MERDTEMHLARAIEAGVTAQAALHGRCDPGDATDIELARIVVAGKRAFNELVEAYIDYAKAVAYREAARLGLPGDELFQEASLGLVEAIWRFDYRRELRLYSYAEPWIRARVMQMAATRCGRLNLSRHQARLWHQVRKAVQRFESAGLRPDVRAIAADLGIDKAHVLRLMAYQAPAAVEVELAAPEPDGEPDIQGWFSEISVQQAEILRRRCGFDGQPQQWSQIAQSLGLSPTQVRRLARTACAQLRRHALEQFAA